MMKLANAENQVCREVCRWLKAHCLLQDAFPFGVRQVKDSSLPGEAPLTAKQVPHCGIWVVPRNIPSRFV